MSREKILALLWPDADYERGRAALAQALYALRKDLGAEDAITGSKELRFDPALVSSDADEFASAISRGDDARAVAIYHGPFLEGFHLPGADTFARWVEQERAVLAREHARALESLARDARTRGDASEAVDWWRKLGGLEPLNARVTVGLMDALAATGDCAAAIKQARVYQLLVQQELDLPPDKEVMAFAERLRLGGAELAPTVSPPPIAAPPETAAPATETPVVSPKPAPIESPTHRAPIRWLIAGGLVGVLAIVAVVLARSEVSSELASSTDRTIPIVAVGRIAAFGGDTSQENFAAPVADLLATSLGRSRGIRVVSQGRMLELMHHAASAGDTTAAGFIDAARRAGASEVIDGTLFTRNDGRLRLDLRRVDLASGAIGDVQTVDGSDLFALVDSGTARIVAALGAYVPQGSVANVTTRSVTAYRMYEQGIHAFYRGDYRTALGFFDGALAEDSLFALAAFYGASSDPAPITHARRLEHAKRLATRASDRERLTIMAGWAYHVSSPTLRQFAETLATRYPTETEGHLYSGIARVYDGEFLPGLEPLERAISMDSLGLRGASPTCSACDALQWRVSAYALADSLAAAEREARRWVRLQPRSVPAAHALVEVLELEGRDRESDSIFVATEPEATSYARRFDFETLHLIRFGDYATADRLLHAQLRQPDATLQSSAYWNLAISLREQGRLADALDAAHRWRVATGRIPDGRQTPPSPLEAQIQLELQHTTVAASQFDSVARHRIAENVPSEVARSVAWSLTQLAGARAASGDTADLERLADSVRSVGTQSIYGRDRRLYHHIRGLLFAARGDDAQAISEFQSAVYSLTLGYTRTNYEMARIHLRNRRPREAVAVLQPALRGSLQASNLYVSRTELHELLAQAWDAAGVRDSAAAHYAWVATVWAAPDSVLAPRAQAARTRLVALRR